MSPFPPGPREPVPSAPPIGRADGPPSATGVFGAHPHPIPPGHVPLVFRFGSVKVKKKNEHPPRDT